jgi:hypothetical protein
MSVSASLRVDIQQAARVMARADELAAISDIHMTFLWFNKAAHGGSRLNDVVSGQAQPAC